eukprot:1527491-Heterocapsa_arctica.AAC.1
MKSDGGKTALDELCSMKCASCRAGRHSSTPLTGRVGQSLIQGHGGELHRRPRRARCWTAPRM